MSIFDSLLFHYYYWSFMKIIYLHIYPGVDRIWKVQQILTKHGAIFKHSIFHWLQANYCYYESLLLKNMNYFPMIDHHFPKIFNILAFCPFLALIPTKSQFVHGQNLINHHKRPVMINLSESFVYHSDIISIPIVIMNHYSWK